MRQYLIALTLTVAACGPQSPDGGPAPPPADAPGVAEGKAAVAAKAASSTMDLSQPMIARGNEPFWAVRMEGKTFTLQRPGVPDMVFEHPGAQVTPGQAILPARAADGQEMTVTLYASECSDGMSDFAYPMNAEVAVAGTVFHGCAAKISQLPKAAPGKG